MSEDKAPQEENKLPEDNKPSMLNISVDDFNKAIFNAKQEGSNMLYSELISYQMSCLEVFSNQFKPANASFEQFLGFVIYTLQQEFNSKYAKKEESKDEKKDDGKPEAVQSQNGESKEAPQERHEDVQGGESGGQEASQEPEQKEEVKDDNQAPA